MYEPYFADVDVKSNLINGIIKKGSTSGIREVTTINSASGLRIFTSHTMKTFTPSDVGYTRITVTGDSGSNSIHNYPEQHVEREADAVINRIEDIIRAKPGFHDNSQLKTPSYTRDLSSPIREF